VGGIFQGSLGRVVGALAAALGASVVGAGLRTNRNLVQYIAAPAVFLGGYLAALVLPNPTGVSGTVPQLVRQAITHGGLAHPPVRGPAARQLSGRARGRAGSARRTQSAQRAVPAAAPQPGQQPAEAEGRAAVAEQGPAAVRRARSGAVAARRVQRLPGRRLAA